MSVSWFIARRYLVARRRQALISLISAVSILGVGVGVMALVIALALMTGVQGELRDRIVGASAHLYVYSRMGPFGDFEEERKRVEGPEVTGLAPAVFGYALIRAGTHDEFVQLKGIDPRYEPAVTDINRAVASGSIEALVDRPADARDGIMLGADLAQKLGVGLGDTVEILTSEPTSTVYGLMPRRRVFDIIGTFRFNFYEFDQSYAFVSLATAEDLLGVDGPQMIQVRLKDLDRARAVRDALQEKLGSRYQVQDWAETNAPLYSALWLEKVAISLTIGLIVMVAALNIVGSLVLLVMEKSRDIAILRTMGATSRVIRRIFVLQGIAIGLIGTTGGTIGGLIVCWVAEKYRLVKLPEDVYQIPYLPFHVLPLDVAIVVVSAILVCFLATIYPSRQAGRLDPAEALRHQ
jgi:lipoprotein-releasing system permease protein